MGKWGRRMVWGWMLVVLLAACGGGGETAVTPTPPPTAAVTAEVEMETAVSTPTAEPPTPTPGGAVMQPDVELFTDDDRSDRLRSLTDGWNTNWERRTIATADILSGGPPRDGIPSIDDPQFVSVAAAEAWLADVEPVVVVEINGDARAYPLQILTWHEIVNDTVGDLPVVVTFCPLCNSAITFERIVDGEAVEFGVSGLLRNSDLIMYDRTDESLWQQFTGEAIIGNHAGKQLRFVPTGLVSFADFRAAHPDGQVLSRETGFNRRYGENPYVGYDAIGSDPFLFTGVVDGRLPATERVVSVSVAGVDVAYPYSVLAELRVVHDVVGQQSIAVFYSGGTASALGARVIAEAEDVGATGVFDPVLDGETLTFTAEGDQFVDAQTGSVWNILGEATDGPLAGTRLTRLTSGDHFWFSWAAFKPDTLLYTGE